MLNVAANSTMNASYTHGASDKPLIGETIGDFLDHIAAEFPDNEALVTTFENQRFTYREFLAETNRVARGLMALGVQKGDRVGIWSTNCAAWVLVQFATAKIGAILVNINPANRTYELEFALRQSECNYLISGERFKDADYAQMLGELIPELAGADSRKDFHAEKFPHLRRVVMLRQTPLTPALSPSDGERENRSQSSMHLSAQASSGVVSKATRSTSDFQSSSPLPVRRGEGQGEGHSGALTWADLLSLSEKVSPTQLAERQASLDFDDVINIQYTSGTTGFPKGAMLTHHNILNNAFFIGERMRFTPRDRLCIPVPFYHCFGMVLGNLVCVTHGATMVLPAPHFSPLHTLQSVKDERCTALHGVPTMFIAELDHPDFKKFNLSTLRTGIMAGAPCPVEVMKRVMSEMHCREITIVCGQTEASPACNMTEVDDPLEVRVGTVGKVMPHQEQKIIDSATGKTLPRGEHGEICYRGHHIMRGYYNNPQATHDAIDAAGWLHSGDMAVMDVRGYVQITGRIKDMICRGGEKIFPREVEEFLFTNPKIAEAYVIGVPDNYYGEQVMVWAKLKPGQTMSADELQTFCHGKIMDYKIPRHVKFVDDFPKTVTGKIQKYKMREISAAELGLEQPVKKAA
ncbi:MAG: AMP-binding protein [Verrucomicrobia bacterium]|nr:MAG: AMP-binding protein [Verrucomicrobiota bacterium]